MSWLSQSLPAPGISRRALAARRHGVVEVERGQLVAIHLRRWPKIISVLEIEYLGRRWHESRPGDRCLLYYNQPRRCPNYLALKYVVSQRGCTLATIRRALVVLDEIARVKRADAILCDVWNSRISEAMLARRGWEPHQPSGWHRNYIKRFYGVYPVSEPADCVCS